MQRLTFIDLFAGMGGFHRALSDLGHECVFASELDDELRGLYLENFPNMKGRVFGDIRKTKVNIPRHDILCAGFPCQPFSKSGSQLGTRDETRGTLFHEILEILGKWTPSYVLLENVGNFSRHDGGRTWAVVRRRLEAIGYRVTGTEHLTPAADRDWRDSGLRVDRLAQTRIKKFTKQENGTGLLSPHHFGEPHHRERFFVLASLDPIMSSPFPERRPNIETSLTTIVQPRRDLSQLDKQETRLTPQQVSCIELWNQLVKKLPPGSEFPSCPIWGDEFLLDYPYTPLAPYSVPLTELRKRLGRAGMRDTREDLLLCLPRYAREEVSAFRQWKVNYITRNREWWREVKHVAPDDWLAGLKSLPPSLRKLEWNAKGGERDLWKYVLQFRPSGLRVKRYTSSPALVAMTVTQIPILGPERRFLSRVEGLRLQGFPDDHLLPQSRGAAFKALGNAVHVAVAKAIAGSMLKAPGQQARTSTNVPNKAQLNNSLRDNNVRRAA